MMLALASVILTNSPALLRCLTPIRAADASRRGAPGSGAPLPRILDFVERFWSRATPLGGCLVWTGATNDDGYGLVYMRGNSDPERAHRISYMLTHGDPGDLHVLHTCDNPPCILPAHLFAGDDADNVHDAMRKGRRAPAFGEYCGNSKLTIEQVRAIIARRAAGEGQKALADEFGVGVSTVQRIVSGELWAKALAESVAASLALAFVVLGFLAL